jgi:hypothetical protein
VDLSLGRAEVQGVLLEGFDPVTEKVRRRAPTRPLNMRRTQDRIEVAGLPEGTVELTFTLCSPAAPVPKEGEAACVASEGRRATPATWTVRVTAILGKVSEAQVDWPWESPP